MQTERAINLMNSAEAWIRLTCMASLFVLTNGNAVRGVIRVLFMYSPWSDRECDLRFEFLLLTHRPAIGTLHFAKPRRFYLEE